MAPPLYFFPKLPKDELVEGDRLRSETLARYGLETSLGGVSSVRRELSTVELPRGGPPENGSGMLLIPLVPGKPPPVRLGMYRDHQQWLQVADDPPLWIGTDVEYPPTPDDLARPRQVEGHWVALDDGNDWMVPIIRSINPEAVTNLPRRIGYDRTGELVARVKPEHEELWARAEQVWDWVYAGGSYSVGEIMPHCLAFLGVNYRIGKWEVERLGLLDTANYPEILRAAVDAPFAEQWAAAEKKRTDSGQDTPPPESSGTEPGETDSTPDTPPA